MQRWTFLEKFEKKKKNIDQQDHSLLSQYLLLLEKYMVVEMAVDKNYYLALLAPQLVLMVL